MADENTTEEVESEDGGAGEAPAKSGGGKLKILILIAVAMIGEAGLFFFLGIGSGGASQAVAEDGQPVEEEAAPEEEEDEQVVEVEIHTFNVTNNTAAADTIVHVSFHLHALVPVDQKELFDQAANTDYKVRVREAIETIVRSATMEDLKDSSLSTLKRLVREEINKVLRQSYVLEVVLSEYKTIDQ